MFYDSILQYTRRILEESGISSYLPVLPGGWKKEYDRGLRDTLIPDNSPDYAGFEELLQNCPEKKICCLTDTYGCEYMILRLPSERPTWLFCGPFVYEKVTYRQINALCSQNKIPSGLLHYMEQYYAVLPHDLSEVYLQNIFRCLGEFLWGSLDELQFERIVETPGKEAVPSAEQDYSSANEKAVETIEKRYVFERGIMDCIRQGSWDHMKEFLSTHQFIPLAQRVQDSLRDQKNGMIVLNTICRKGAEYARVHPYYLDQLSSQFAVSIESATSSRQLQLLRLEMFRKYCSMVQTRSVKDYSRTVSDAVNYISFDLTADLSLSAIAKKLSLNPGYLSSIFKKETGQTLTSYVIDARLSRALFLLNATNYSVQQVAAQSGFEDVNYFIRLFKREKDMTPGAYKKMLLASAK